MESQYRLEGLRVAIVDGSARRAGAPPALDQLLNYTYRWNLQQIPVLPDPDAQIACAYGVEHLPTTFLIGADDRIAHRWDRLVPVAELGQALRDLLGRPTLAPR